MSTDRMGGLNKKDSFFFFYFWKALVSEPDSGAEKLGVYVNWSLLGHVADTGALYLTVTLYTFWLVSRRDFVRMAQDIFLSDKEDPDRSKIWHSCNE